MINAKSDEDVAKCYSGIQEVFPEFNQYYVDIILSKKEAKKVKRAPSAITELGSFSKVTPIKRGISAQDHTKHIYRERRP